MIKLKHLNLYTAVPLLIIACILIPVTAAFMVSDNTLKNHFTVGFNNSNIEEKFGEYTELESGKEYEKVIAVRNNGNVPCYVRMFAETENPDTAINISIDFNSVNWTEKQNDGFYYYKKNLQPGVATEPLFSTIAAKSDVKDFRMICYSETIQSEGYSNAQMAFSEVN